MLRERDQETSAILGAAVQVHRVLGRGFLEAVYQRALGVELDERRIPFVTEAPVAVRYKGQELG